MLMSCLSLVGALDCAIGSLRAMGLRPAHGRASVDRITSIMTQSSRSQYSRRAATHANASQGLSLESIRGTVALVALICYFTCFLIIMAMGSVVSLE